MHDEHDAAGDVPDDAEADRRRRGRYRRSRRGACGTSAVTPRTTCQHAVGDDRRRRPAPTAQRPQDCSAISAGRCQACGAGRRRRSRRRSPASPVSSRTAVTARPRYRAALATSSAPLAGVRLLAALAAARPGRARHAGVAATNPTASTTSRTVPNGRSASSASAPRWSVSLGAVAERRARRRGAASTQVDDARGRPGRAARPVRPSRRRRCRGRRRRRRCHGDRLPIGGATETGPPAPVLQCRFPRGGRGECPTSRSAWASRPAGPTRLDEVALVPSRRTREPEKVDLTWEIDAFRFGAPVLAAPSDAVSSPATAGDARRGRRRRPSCTSGACGPATTTPAALLAALGRRRRRRRARGASAACATPTPRRRAARPRRGPHQGDQGHGRHVRRRRLAGPGRGADAAPAEGRARPARDRTRRSCRPSTSSDSNEAPLNLKTFIRRFELPVLVGGCASYQARAAPHAHRRRRRDRAQQPRGRRRARRRRPARHRRRRRPGRPHAPPRRDRRLLPRPRRGRHPHRRRHRQGGRLRRRRRACSTRCSPAPSDAPGGGWWWDHGIAHADACPSAACGASARRRRRAPLAEQLLVGPGVPNLLGALRKAMALHRLRVGQGAAEGRARRDARRR